MKEISIISPYLESVYSVEILNENEDLILSDNYFDLNGDSKTVEVISGDTSKLRLRSVYDIH